MASNIKVNGAFGRELEGNKASPRRFEDSTLINGSMGIRRM